MAAVATIFIAVGDAVLADSLRFSLELEGYAAKLCDELSVLTFAEANGDDDLPGCLLIDQDVFVRVAGSDGDGSMAVLGMPVVLMVGQKTPRLVNQAKAAGVTRVVEKPLVGGVLFDEIRGALDTWLGL